MAVRVQVPPGVQKTCEARLFRLRQFTQFLVDTSRSSGRASNGCAGSSPARASKDCVKQVFFVLRKPLALMFYVYILRSEKSGRYYIGYSENPEARLAEHNSGKAKSTRNYRPWTKVYQEEFLTEQQAVQRERQIKSMKSRHYIESLF
jgi:putative endonuclease